MSRAENVGRGDGLTGEGDTPGPERTDIRIATYSIRSGRNGWLEIALRAMKQMNIDLGLFTEAKLTDGIHTRFSSEYTVVATNARVHNQGGVALFYRSSPFWQVESVKRYGPNPPRRTSDARKVPGILFGSDNAGALNALSVERTSRQALYLFTCRHSMVSPGMAG